MRIDVLGALTVTSPDLLQPHLSRSIQRLIAIIAAAGREGIDRDQVATELWGDPPPESWKSALRNRMTAARKLLGSDTILNHGGRFRFADTVVVDSWELIAHCTTAFADDQNQFAFLDGVPFDAIESSGVLSAHAELIGDARLSLIQQVIASGTALSPLALQSLRYYQRRQPTNAALATETIKAHVQADLLAHATELVAEIKTRAKQNSKQNSKRKRELVWLSELDEVLRAALTIDDAEQAPPFDPTEVAARAELFEAAVDDGNWGLALEIAMAGLPEAERSDGDPPRLALLEAIPFDRLDARQQFRYSLAMARHLMYAYREDEARGWSRVTRTLATTPDQVLQSFIIAAILGESDDPRRPIPLPKTFVSAPLESVSMQSIQVAVMSHLERAPFSETEALRSRFTSLVESCGRPYRRWHLLLLQSMYCFVDGELKAAAEAARTAHKYAELFNIRAGENALLGQLSNAYWLHPGFPGIDDYEQAFPTAAGTNLGRAVRAVTSVDTHGNHEVDAFLRTFNHLSRTFFAFPLLALIAPHVSDSRIRAEMIGRLRERTGTSAIYSTGVLHLGPVDRIVARTVESEDEAVTHLAAAIDVADQQEMRLWQVICRLDLAAITDDTTVRSDAHELATTPNLEQLTVEYCGIR